MASWARVDVLVLDDLGLEPVPSDLLEVIEDRSSTRSSIVTSQLPVGHWHEALGDPTVADAILDRLVHGAHRLELRGDSRRRAADRASDRPTTPGTTPSDGPGRPRRDRGDMAEPVNRDETHRSRNH